MLNVKVDAKINMRLVGEIQRKEEKLLYKAGAYVRGVARKKIKVSPKRTKHGKPGQAWIAHSQTARNSVSFAVDKANKSVTVGLEKLNGRKLSPEGKPTSEILEHGGRPTIIQAPFYNRRKKLRDLIQSVGYQQAAYEYYRTDPGKKGAYHSAPAFYSSTAAGAIALRDKASNRGFANMRGGRKSNKKTYQMQSAVDGKTYYIAPIKLTSIRQAKRVGKTLEKLQGYPVTKAKYQKARPVIALAWQASEPFVKQLFHGFVNKE